jgi:signal recognition particle GTPase
MQESMSDDDWNDWEYDEFIVPTISLLNPEQLKRIEERKLIEESDTELSKELFSDVTSHQKFIVKNEFAKTSEDITKTKQNIESKIKKTKYVNKQLENELTQKDISKKITETKLKKLREIELYGEAEEIDEYDEYDILYHS